MFIQADYSLPSMQDDELDPSLEYHADRSLLFSSSVENSSSSSRPSSVEGTKEFAKPAKDHTPSIIHLKEHEQKEATKAEFPPVQVTELTIAVRPEEVEPEATHPTDCKNAALESSEAASAAAVPPTEDQLPPTVGKEEHVTETPSIVNVRAEAVEKPAEAHPPSPVQEDEEYEDPGPLPVRQRIKRFSEPSKPVSPGNPVFSVGLLARHPQSYPQLSQLEEKEEGEERRDRVAAAVGWIDKELRKVGKLCVVTVAKKLTHEHIRCLPNLLDCLHTVQTSPREEPDLPAGNEARLIMFPLLLQLIAEIQRLGCENEAGQTEVKFGLLFEETANTFEALSGILRTAKKHKVRVEPTLCENINLSYTSHAITGGELLWRATVPGGQ